jgi:hypothetical protein
MDHAHALGYVGDFGGGEQAHKTLLDHEGGKRAEASVPPGAAVGDVAATAHHVKALGQRAAAACALQAGPQGLARRVTVFVQEPEQIGHCGGQQFQGFLRVDPHAVAGKAQVQLNGLAMVAGQGVHLHGGTARWAWEGGGGDHGVSG